MADTRHSDLLNASLWDLRANCEAQIRDLTAMQRCLDDFRAGERGAVNEMDAHLHAIALRADAVNDSLREAKLALDALKTSE
jgi:hypothetical protein